MSDDDDWRAYDYMSFSKEWAKNEKRGMSEDEAVAKARDKVDARVKARTGNYSTGAKPSNSSGGASKSTNNGKKN